MDRQISFGQYKLIDNALFAGMLVISEIIIITASSRWFPGQLYTVSVTAAITAIVMMRWGCTSAFHAALGALVYVGIQKGSPGQFLIYIIGNEAALLLIPVVRLAGKKKIRENVVLTMVYALSVQLLMQLGRGIVSVVLGSDAGAILKFITMDALSLLFTILIVYVASRLDGVFEDQKSYLLRIQKEKELENGDI